MPLTFLCAVLFLAIRKLGMQRMVWSKKLFMKIGIFPIRDHYYEPLFNPRHLRMSLREDRELPAIDLNPQEQLGLLSQFTFSEELKKIPLERTNQLEFYYHNPSFGAGDAEYLYSMIRLFKPKKIVEIGSGYSTLLAVSAIRQNRQDDSQYSCELICIEPYEMEWLEKLGVKIIREKVETVNKEIFSSLEANDILFVDSSHIIRPQGDVLFEYLEVLPILKSGVLVHVHDIFTPKDYFDDLILTDVRFWNEQYLLEAFMSFNKGFRIIGALNYLKHHYFEGLSAQCPVLAQEPKEEPCSFWLIKAENPRTPTRASKKISFIIASVDRDQELQQCVTSIEKAHEYRRDISIEILVVIQKAKQKKNIRIEYPDITTVYYIDQLGLSVARNFAIAKSVGDFLVFLDDDASVSVDFIDVLSRKFSDYKDINAFCGRLIDPVQQLPFSRLFSNTKVKKLRRIDFQYFMGSAHVLSRKILQKIGTYDERFGVGSTYYGSEESDIFFRLKAANEPVIYMPDLVFFHAIPVVPSSYVYNYSYAVGAMLTKHCLRDKVYFYVYLFIVLKTLTKSSIRILQKFLFKDRYTHKDERYHYGAVLRGTLDGIRAFIKKEIFRKNK